MENLGRNKNPWANNKFPRPKKYFLGRIRKWKTCKEYEKSCDREITQERNVYIRQKRGEYKGCVFFGKWECLSRECWVCVSGDVNGPGSVHIVHLCLLKDGEWWWYVLWWYGKVWLELVEIECSFIMFYHTHPPLVFRDARNRHNEITL